MKNIYILLTKHDDWMARIFNACTFTHFSHVSVSLEENQKYFYSFVTKSGFYTERPLKSKNPRKRKRACELLKLQVTPEVYNELLHRIEQFKANKANYRYSYIGIIACLFGIGKYKNMHEYFCSQFVSEVLHATKALHIDKASTLVLPDDFRVMPGLEVVYSGTIGGLIKQHKHKKYVYTFTY